MKALSLRTRLTLLLGTTTLVALGIAARVVDWRADTEMQQRFDTTLLSRAQALAALTRIQGSGIGFDAFPASAALFPASGEDDRYAVRCHGGVIASSARVPPRLGPGAGPRFANATLPDGRVMRVVALRFTPQHGGGGQAAASTPPVGSCELEYAIDRGTLDDILWTLDLIMVGSTLGAFAMVLALTPWLVRRGLRPVAALNRAMVGIGPDIPGRRLPASAPPELTPLVTRFNEVLARMDDGLARERQFAAGMAHEFRTRLAELRTLIEVETRYPSDRDLRDLLREIGSIGVEMEATVGALLKLTRIESGLESAARDSVRLQPLLTEMLSRHADEQSGRGPAFRFTPPEADATVEADAALFGIVLDNLLGNAVAYAPPGSAIDVFCVGTAVEVVNLAPNLDERDLAKFGRRFWRKQAGSADQHAGLGLALADAAARAMQMRLDFRLGQDSLLHATLSWQPPAGPSAAERD